MNQFIATITNVSLYIILALRVRLMNSAISHVRKRVESVS